MKKKLVFMTAVLLAIVSQFAAAGTMTIVDLPATGTDAAIGISTSKTYTHTFDFGTNAAVTINGVPFMQGLANELNNKGAGVTFTSTSLQGYAYTIADTRTNKTDIRPHAGETVILASQADGQSAGLLRDMVYHNSSSTIGAGLSITLSGLTAGTSYSTRIYYRCWIAVPAATRTITVKADGGHNAAFTDTLNVEWDGGGAHYLDYTFVSDDSNVTLQFLTNDNNNGIHMYGLTNELGYSSKAWAPNPSDGQGLATSGSLAIRVPLDKVLSWNAPNDPRVDPAYTLQYAVYMDPNQTKVSTATGCQYTRAMGTAASFDPVPDMAHETQYYWRVDTQVKFLSDPNIYTLQGSMWKFKTVSPLPMIVTNPVNTKAAPDGTAQFTVTYTSVNPVTNVTWYKGATALVAGGNISISTLNNTDSTLSIANPVSDEGEYHCTITNNPGGMVTSGNALLVLKKKLAWYQFENNLNDSAGTNHGTLVGPTGGMAYVTDMPGTISGQAYSADPNGGVYADVSAIAYPKPGFGNGLEEGTISYWVKLAPDTFGSIYGTYNGAVGTTPLITAIRSRVDNTGKVHFHVRNEAGTGAEPISANIVDDNQWHFVTAVITSSGVTLYVDVTDKVTVTSSVAAGTFAAWQYPMILMANNNRSTIEDKFPGVMDDLKIENYAKTPEEIAQAYYDVTGKGSCIYSAASGLEYDYNKNCKVDLPDLVQFFSKWLECGLYPNCL